MAKKIFILLLVFSCISTILIAQTWDNLQRLSYNSGNSYVPRIAIDSTGNVHVVWYDDSSGGFEIYYKNGSSGGEGTWTTAQRLTYSNGDAKYPFVVVDINDFINVIYSDNSSGDYELYHKRSTDSGSSWESPIQITYSTGDAKFPIALADGNNFLRLFYADDKNGNYEIFYKEKSLAGNWENLSRITWTSGDSSFPWTGMDSTNRIHVVWQDNTTGDYELYHKSTPNTGDTWSITTRITYSSGHSNDPRFDIDPSTDHLRLVWHEWGYGSPEVCYKERNPSGFWIDYLRLTYSSGWASHPTVLVEADRTIHVVYQDNASGDFELYHKNSTDYGTNFSSPTRITWSSGDTQYPHMTQGNFTHLRLVYYDNGPGNNETYFKRGNLN